MAVIDVHSHVTPPSFREAVLDGGTWHTLTNAIGELEIPEFSISAPDRIAKMDAARIDMPTTPPPEPAREPTMREILKARGVKKRSPF